MNLVEIRCDSVPVVITPSKSDVAVRPHQPQTAGGKGGAHLFFQKVLINSQQDPSAMPSRLI